MLSEKNIAAGWVNDFCGFMSGVLESLTGSGSGLKRLRRRGRILKPRPTSWESRGSHSGSLGTRRLTYPLHHGGSLSDRRLL